MPGYGDNFIPVIPIEEGEMIHTAEHPFCSNPDCFCHEDEEEIAVVNGYYQDGLVTPQEATDIVAGKTKGAMPAPERNLSEQRNVATRTKATQRPATQPAPQAGTLQQRQTPPPAPDVEEYEYDEQPELETESLPAAITYPTAEQAQAEQKQRNRQRDDMLNVIRQTEANRAARTSRAGSRTPIMPSPTRRQPMTRAALIAQCGTSSRSEPPRLAPGMPPRRRSAAQAAPSRNRCRPAH